jgi:hypothetical protein
LQIASQRKDGSLRSTRIIWGVRVGADLYVRAGGVEKDVTFVEESDSNINDQIDAAYASKYQRYASIISSINSSTARSATLRLVPR